jgi:hypothetical protein
MVSKLCGIKVQAPLTRPIKEDVAWCSVRNNGCYGRGWGLNLV